MALSPRFQLDDILGNEVVDFQVLQANNDKLDAGAASLTLANAYSNVQTLHRAALTDPALDIRLTGDAPTAPRLRITADGVISWTGGSIGPGAGGTLTINATSVTLGNLKAGAGTAAAPSYSFSTDPDTGLYSPSGDVLGIAVGGVEVNRINNVGEIRFNRTNARIAAGPSDDPNTPGEYLVRINALEILPGRLHATGGASISTLQVNTTSVLSGAVTMSSTLNVASTTTVSGTINAYGGRVNFEGSNAVYIQWRGDLGALYIPYGNGVYTSHGRFTGNITVDGTASIGRLVAGGYDAGWQVNLGAGGSGVITNGRFYQRGNGGYYCWDAGDFTYSVAGSASTLVQRDGNGGAQFGGGGNLYWPSGAIGGKPTHVLGQGGDGYFHWYAASAIGPPVLSVLATDVNGATGTGGAWVDKAVLTVNRTGYWVLIYHFYIGGGSPDAWGCFTRPRWGGTIGVQQAMNFPVGGAVNFGWHTLYDGDAVLVTNGTQVACQMNCDNNHNFGMTTKFHAVFVPTTNYPG